MSKNQEGQTRPPRHAVILFYKYFSPRDYSWLQKDPRRCERVLLEFLQDTCRALHLRGRLLVAAEGVNGTLSAPSRELIDDFIHRVESFEFPVEADASENQDNEINRFLFTKVDWKHSTSECEPFPDMKVVIVKEIISSGEALSVAEIDDYGGRHLAPREFHSALQEDPNVVLVDVRNPIEYEVGHFVSPLTTEPAINPNMVTFASFDTGFCAKQAEALRGKKVLMYCTGGIRCEKASAMLRRRGVEDVSQLKGGIHRYLEEFGDDGYFKGLNFVFDRRVVMSGSDSKEPDGVAVDSQRSQEVVGRCYECSAPFDQVSGSNICTVCRDVCLICTECKQKLREYHCRRHAEWKTCYFTFLEVFDHDELESHRQQLKTFLDACLLEKSHKSKNIRRTLTRQIDKISERIRRMDAQEVVFDRDAPRRCRSCFEPTSDCDGCCWGFWKSPNECVVADCESSSKKPKLDKDKDLLTALPKVSVNSVIIDQD